MKRSIEGNKQKMQVPLIIGILSLIIGSIALCLAVISYLNDNGSSSVTSATVTAGVNVESGIGDYLLYDTTNMKIRALNFVQDQFVGAIDDNAVTITYEVEKYVISEMVDAAQIPTAAVVGQFTSRNLNTLETLFDPPSVTLSNKQFTVEAGRWTVEAEAVAYRSGNHKLRLVQIGSTGNTIIANGLNGFSANNIAGSATPSTLDTFLNLSAPSTFQLEHYVQTDGSGSQTFGPIVTQGSEVFAKVVLTRLY